MIPPCGFFCGILALLLKVGPVWAGELWVVDPQGLKGPENALLASIQGVLNRTSAVVWVKGPGMNARILEDLRDEGWVLREVRGPWSLLREHRAAFAGLIIGQVGTESLNRATTLAGLTNALVAAPSLVEQLVAEGWPVLADARSRSNADVWTETRARVARGVMIHQDPSKTLHLRDLAMSLGAWTVYEEPAAERTRQVQALGPHTRVYGWGRDELEFVREVSQGGGAVIPADWSLNLSALRHLPATRPVRSRPAKPRARSSGERVVAFVVSDGDNLQWVGGRFVDDPGFWASPLRGRFAVTWEMPPEAWVMAPRILGKILGMASPNDDFIAGPSGYGYQFPSHLPGRPA
ncbi:MAG: GxGYxYP family putative glycoside hydrolase, partial [Verrucomicrobiota bacterium]|nr:GxGYxYP family putative glycoside hydrolase [Verrucomicrobiota bacterium]